MEFYLEYPIRCMTCNEQIEAHAPKFESMVGSGISVEDALNAMGITTWCSRIAFMVPVIVNFNMENRDAIDGLKPVASVSGPSKELPYLISAPEMNVERAPGMEVNAEIEGIVVEPNADEFKIPIRIGVSTTNKDRNKQDYYVNVGSGKRTAILTRRTYLAR